MKKCTKGPRHKWTWVKDVTTRSGRFGPSGGSLTIARQGVYTCECGERKYGEAKTGFPAEAERTD